MAEGGIDLNIVTGAVTSDGAILPMPRTSPDEMRKLARLQKGLARKKKGSRNRNKARRAVANFQAKLTRRRKSAAHVISHKLATAFTHVAFENLKLQAMTASAAGTIEAPSKNVQQKAGLNRAFLDVAPGAIRRFTKYKLGWAGGICVEVHAAYTSQTCSQCRRHPKDDAATQHLPHGRIDRDHFICPLCGYAAHADINAARNILALGRQQWAATFSTPTDRRGQPAEASVMNKPETGKTTENAGRLPQAA